MNMRNTSCLLVVGTVVSFAAAFNVVANPVAVTYTDTAAQCVDPPNVNLTEELGPTPPFPAGERIIYTVDAAIASDCSIAVGPWVNDGCAAVGAAESGAQCSNNTDDDGDLKVNDGCPQAGAAPEAGPECDNNTDNDAADDADDYQITATNMSGFCLADVFVVADTGTTFGNWDGNIAGSRAKKIADVKPGWPNGSVITFRLMNVAPNVAPNFDSLGVNSAGGPSNFSIVANIVKTDGVGACCAASNNQCLQRSECECKGLGSGYTYRGAGTPCGTDGTCIPTVSEWGLAVMAILVLTAGTIVVMRRRSAVA